MNQVIATTKKDLIGLTRTFRIFVIIAIGFFSAILQPITLKFMVPLLEVLQVPADIISSLPEGNLLMALASVFAELADIGLLVLLLCIMSFIGGEQKKKLLTIPITKGLTLESYVISKFVLFPIIGFIFGFVFSLIGYSISLALFDNIIPMVSVILSSALVGVEIMFTVVIATAVGILTSRPGIGIAIIYSSRVLVTSILTAIGYNRFNPFALNLYASVFEYAVLSEVMITLAITFGIAILIFIFTFLKTQRRKLKY